MRRFAICALAGAIGFFATPAIAWPGCEAGDHADLCAIAEAALADNPAVSDMSAQSLADTDAYAERHAQRRARARTILDGLHGPNWRDLFRAGYVIAYGDTPEEHLLAHAIAIRALSLAPDEPDVRFLVAMTIDEIGRKYLGAQVYGRQRFYQFDTQSGAQTIGCLPQMIDPPLPASVGVQFHDSQTGLENCPAGIGVR